MRFAFGTSQRVRRLIHRLAMWKKRERYRIERGEGGREREQKRGVVHDVSFIVYRYRDPDAKVVMGDSRRLVIGYCESWESRFNVQHIRNDYCLYIHPRRGRSTCS